MEYKRVKIKPWPTALNTMEDPRGLLSNECPANDNLILSINNDLRAHYPISAVEITAFDCTIKKILAAHPFISGSGKNGILAYASLTYSTLLVNRLFYILEGQIQLSVDNIFTNPFYGDNPPYFVNYQDKIYVLREDIYRFSTTDLDLIKLSSASMSLPVTSTGCVLKNRFWVADRGMLRYTEPNEFSFPALNFLSIGNTNEDIVSLTATEDKIFIGKNREVWQLMYDSTIDQIKLFKINEGVGVASLYTTRNKYKTNYFYNNYGVYLHNPENVEVSPKNLLEITPGLYKISETIDDDFKQIKIIPRQTIIDWLRNTSGEDWESNEWEYKYDPHNALVFGGTMYITKGSNHYASVVKRLGLVSGNKWDRIRIKGKRYIMGFPHTLNLYIKYGTDGQWEPLPPTGSEVLDGLFLGLIWDYLVLPENYEKDAIRIKFELGYLDVSGPLGPPEFNFAEVTSYPKVNNIGSGIYKNAFYVFAEDTDGNRKNLRFHPKYGWSNITFDNFEVYNLFDSVKWTDGYNIIGVGRSFGMDCGAFIKESIPEIMQGSMSIHGTTGELDFGAPDLPKKIRQIFIAYKTVGNLSLKIYDERGLLDTITLPNQSELAEREINFQSDRSKWYQFDITCETADLIITDFDVGVKIFAPNET